MLENLMATIHIIGAGLAGLTAAVKLADNGAKVILYELAPQAGGRCRSFYDPTLGHIIDNGNHLILGANTHALNYIDKIRAQDTFIKGAGIYPFKDIASGQEWIFNNFYSIPDTKWPEYLDLIHLACSSNTKTVAKCFNNSSQLYNKFIEPFCLAALNCHPKEASARLLRNVLWELLKHGKQGLQHYLPKHSLSASLIDPALDYIKAYGGIINYNSALKSLVWEDGKVASLQLIDNEVNVEDDSVILAIPPYIANKLLPELSLPTGYNAIVNGHFLCPNLTWPYKAPFIALLGGTAHWLFYRNGILSTTTSAAGELAHKDNTTIARALWNDICLCLNIISPLPTYRIICEKKATLASPSLTPIKKHYGNLALAGDYTEHTLPNTIDTAIKSGFAAAAILYSKS
jgi:squalene-associated FAD-dependent desaturase